MTHPTYNVYDVRFHDLFYDANYNDVWETWCTTSWIYEVRDDSTLIIHGQERLPREKPMIIFS